ncbi:urease subunit beta [Izhakiella australiensis]|uniref:Urease subunit beta n=1 Tax=Izhakiella australiensis TaxID=1926881 RepID=A0A1S8YRZ2_9GAMM|nr:urease subunit beta [Izhakiella australiensis]OON41909.1 urease subunit beta [Izhakiella australiensis]
MNSKKDLTQIAPGGYVLAETPVSFNQDKTETRLKVRNTGDRPIQVGAHFHFFEANKALKFDRSAAWGKRLNITATTAIRFEPGDEVDVALIEFGGKQTVYGFNNLVDGWVGCSPVAVGERAEKKRALAAAIALNYQTIE